MERYVQAISRVLFLFTVAVFICFVFFLDPDMLVRWIGVDNGYVLLFVFAFISGVSVFGVTPYHLLLITLSTAGLNPLLLAIAATLGLGIGDSTSYVMGYQGRSLVPKHIEPVIERLSHFFEKHTKLVPLYLFLYGICAPFSNDFVGVSLGILRYPFWRVMIPLLSGTFIFNLALGVLATRVYEFFPYITGLFL